MTPAEKRKTRERLRLEMREIEQYIRVCHADILHFSSEINKIFSPILEASAYACGNPLPNLSFDAEWSEKELQYRIKCFIDEMWGLKRLHAKHHNLHKELQATYTKP